MKTASQWFPIPVDLPDDPMVHALNSELGRPLTLAYIIQLWSYAWKFAPEGIFHGRGKVTAAGFVEHAVRWTGERGRLARAFVTVGFLDQVGDTLVIADWQEGPGGQLEALRKDRERKAAKRQADQAPPPSATGTPPVGDGPPGKAAPGEASGPDPTPGGPVPGPGQSADGPVPVRGQSADRPEPVRGKSAEIPVPVRGNSAGSPAPVRGTSVERPRNVPGTSVDGRRMSGVDETRRDETKREEKEHIGPAAPARDISSPSAPEEPGKDPADSVTEVFTWWQHHVQPNAELTENKRNRLGGLFRTFTAAVLIQAAEGYRGSKYWNEKGRPPLRFERVFADESSIEAGLQYREKDWKKPLPLPQFRQPEPAADVPAVVVTNPDERRAVIAANRPAFAAEAER